MKNKFFIFIFLHKIPFTIKRWAQILHYVIQCIFVNYYASSVSNLRFNVCMLYNSISLTYIFCRKIRFFRYVQCCYKLNKTLVRNAQQHSLYSTMLLSMHLQSVISEFWSCIFRFCIFSRPAEINGNYGQNSSLLYFIVFNVLYFIVRIYDEK